MKPLSDHKDLILYIFCATLFTLIAILTWGFTSWSGVCEYSRLALTVALVDDQSFIIDSYLGTFNMGNPTDLAYYDGHYYTDKAIGLSIIIIPGFLIGKIVYLMIGGSIWAYIYWTSLFSCIQMGWMCATMPIGLKRLVGRLGYSEISCYIVSMGATLATPFFFYAITLYPHALSATLLVWALEKLFPYISDWRSAFLSGVLCGLSIFTTFFNAIFVVIIGIATLIRIYSLSGDIRFDFLLLWGIPIVSFAVILLAHNYFAFGDIFTTSYAFGVKQPLQDQWFNPFSRLWYDYLVSYKKSIFIYAPLITFGFLGVCYSMRDNPNRWLYTTIVCIFGVSLLFYCSYVSLGGHFGPRYFVPSLVLLHIPAAKTFDKFKGRRLFLVIFFVLMGIAVYIELYGMAPHIFPRPFIPKGILGFEASPFYDESVELWGEPF